MNKKILFLIILFLGIAIFLVADIIFPGGLKNMFHRAPAPIILSISPTGLPQNSIGVTLRVYGRNFTEKSVIYWNGTTMPTDTKNVAYGFLTTDIPPSNFTNYGAYPITVGNGAKSTSNAIDFTVGRTLKITPEGATI